MNNNLGFLISQGFNSIFDFFRKMKKPCEQGLLILLVFYFKGFTAFHCPSFPVVISKSKGLSVYSF